MLRTGLSLVALVATAALLLAYTRGEPVDLLVTGGTVVTMDADRRVIEDGAVAIRGERIVAVGPASKLARRYRARRRLRADGRLVLPGLINAHTHAAMTLYRGVADDLTLEEWLRNYIFPLEAKLTPAGVRLLGNQAGGAGDDSQRDYHFCGHVLFRRQGRRGVGRSRPARGGRRNPSWISPLPISKPPPRLYAGPRTSLTVGRGTRWLYRRWRPTRPTLARARLCRPPPSWRVAPVLRC